MDQGQRQADSQWRKADGRASMGRAEYDEQKNKRAAALADEARQQTVFCGAEIAVPVGGEAADLESWLPRGYHVEYRGGDNGTDDLGSDVREDVSGLKPPGSPPAKGDCRIEMGS